MISNIVVKPTFLIFGIYAPGSWEERAVESPKRVTGKRRSQRTIFIERCNNSQNILKESRVSQLSFPRGQLGVSRASMEWFAPHPYEKLLLFLS
uniref:Uncharacterized protein n=1 Tax=Romanomermis culicivorax TaxID=13658 RepID=A0A915HTV7_ROMCU